MRSQTKKCKTDPSAYRVLSMGWQNIQ